MPNITPRKNKAGDIISYRIRVSRGYDSSGKKLKPYEMTWKPDKNRTAKQNEKALTHAVELFEEQCRTGLASVDSSQKLADFCPRYLEIQKSILSPRVWSEYARAIERLIIPTLGHLKLKDIRPAHVQSFISYLQGDVKQRRDGTLDTNCPKLSQATVQRKLTILQSILKQAVKLELIPTSPADAAKLTLPRVTAPAVEIFTKQEAAEMLQCLESESLQFQTLVQLAIITGARAGELCALKFSDFDFINQRCTIERSAYKVTGQPIGIKPPKDGEVRSVTVNRHCITLVQLLQEEKRQTAQTLGTAWVGNDWLFTQWNGEIMNPQTPSKQFSKFLQKHDLKHRKFHALRHTSATLLLYGGVDIKAVQTRLGHSELSTTNKYLHLVEEADVQAANVLDGMLTITKTDSVSQVKEA